MLKIIVAMGLLKAGILAIAKYIGIQFTKT
jgi:hypothetical protein